MENEREAPLADQCPRPVLTLSTLNTRQEAAQLANYLIVRETEPYASREMKSVRLDAWSLRLVLKVVCLTALTYNTRPSHDAATARKPTYFTFHLSITPPDLGRNSAHESL